MSALPFRQIELVVNPIAGSGRALRTAERLAAMLRAEGAEVRLHATRARHDAREHLSAQRERADLVVAIGGDGTVREVFEGLERDPVPVLVLPQGTANVLGLDLQLPREAAGALRLIRSHRLQRIDLAAVHTSEGRRLSFLVSGIGFDAAVVHALERRRQGSISKLTWVAAGWEVFRSWREPQLGVEIDGKRLPGRYGWVLFSNIVHYAGLRVLSPDRALDDGQFEVYLFEHCSRAGMMRHQLRALTRGLPGGACQRVRARCLRVESANPAPCQIDGDAAGWTPFGAEVLAQQRTLLVPS
ncbi:MAG: Diacylglycerol kinase [Planctomycetota bacterium]